MNVKATKRRNVRPAHHEKATLFFGWKITFAGGKKMGREENRIHRI